MGREWGEISDPLIIGGVYTMEKKWHKTNFKGVRFYYHPTRKVGTSKAVRDRYFAIRYQKNGKRVEEGIGWASELDPKDGKNWTPEKVALVLAELREASRGLKEGPSRLAERRKIEEEKKEKAQAELQQLARDSIAVSDYFDKIYYPWVKDNKAMNTQRTETILFDNWIRPFIGDMPMTDVSSFDTERIKKGLVDAGKSARTIEYALAVVRQIFNHAKRKGVYVGDHPTTGVKKPKVDNARLRYLMPDEIDKLLTALREKSIVVHDQAVLAVNCGLRFSEVAGLRWEDVNYDTGTMSIRDAKTGSRTVFLNNEVMAVLKSRQDDQKTGLIFPVITEEGDQTEQSSVSKSFQRVADKLFNKDIKDRRLRISFHSLRHTFGTHVYENSGDLYLTQKALGHRTMVMAARYAKLSETKLREAFSKMADVMEKGRQAKADKQAKETTVMNFQK